jgi:acetyltransferase-like isoleucine patch superfamily enzyme
MKAKFLILYSWLVRTTTFFLPDVPVAQRFRGWLYSFGMKRCGKRFRPSHNVVLNRLEKLHVGNNVYLACGCVVTGGGDVTIGDNVLFGPNVVISAANHKFDGVSFTRLYDFGKIEVEKNAWIGANACLLMGTYIAHTSIVGAGSVCNKAFDKPFSLIAGVPAQVIKDLNLPNTSEAK